MANEVFFVGRLTVHDPAGMAGYAEATLETITAHGGRQVLRSTWGEALEGDAHHPTSVVLVAFPSRAAALTWWRSPAYRPLAEQRRSCAHLDALLIGDEGSSEPLETG